MNLSDADIMAAVQQGRTELFDRLVDRYRVRLVRFAVSKLGDVQRAEDAVQEALLAAFTARDSYDNRFAFSTWLWTILLNVCRREWRRGSRRTDVSVAAFSPEPTTPETGLAAALAAERSELLLRMLDQLPEAESDAVRLRFLGELKFDEIALAMDSSVSGAKVRVKRGIERLANLLHDSSLTTDSVDDSPEQGLPHEGGRHEL